MNRRELVFVIGAALLGAVLAALAGQADAAGAAGAFSALWCLAGGGLRALSLSGFGGNLATWLITLLVCALPLLLIFWSLRRPERRGAEDWLAVLMVPVLFAGLFTAVNPTLLPQPAGAFFPLAAGGCLLSLLIAWLVLKLLRGMEGCSQQRLLGALRPLLVGGAMLLSFGATAGRVSLFLARSGAVTQGNTADPGAALFTNGVLLFLALLELTPDLLGAVALLWGAALAVAMGQRLFGERAVALGGRTAAGCRIVVQATVLLAVFSNLLQLALLGQMRSTSFSADLPLFPLLLAGALFLLCRLMEQGKALQDDSDSII